MKKNKKLTIISVIAFIFLFSLLVFLLNNQNNVEEADVNKWLKKAKTGTPIVTVIGSSTCSHCQEYKPVISSLSNKYKFKLFFFEVDTLSEEDKDILYNTYDLEDFDGHIPYTFILKDNKFVTSQTGYANRDSVVDFLKENEIIEN